MIVKYRTRFSLIKSGKDSEERQIFLVSTIEGNEVFYYSGYRIHPDNFIKEKITLVNATVYVQQVKKNTFNKAGESASKINARLKELENASLLVFEREYKGQDIEFDKEYFKICLQKELGEYIEEPTAGETYVDFFECFDKFIHYPGISENVTRTRKSDKNRLKEYESTLKHPITFENFNVQHYTKYVKKDRATNTVVSIMKRLRTFFNLCKDKMKVIKSTPFDDIDFGGEIGFETYEEPVCMTREELTQLYITDKIKLPDQKLIRDMFCLQAALGCRVGDFMRLTYNNIQGDSLVYFPSKTSIGASASITKVIVPLSNRAKEIIKKYKGHKKGNLLMPYVDSVEYNEQLKSVFRIAELDRTIVRFDRDKKVEVYEKLHELASSHLARRTFVDILCQAGEPIHVVASMSGHAEDSKAFDRYRRRPEQLQIKAVNNSMD